MAESTATALAKPMTTWEKIKTGAKAFFKSAVEYIPRGLIFTGILLGGSALLGLAVPGMDLLGALSGPQHVLGHIGLTMLIGGAISGGLGAHEAIKHETHQRHMQIAAQAELMKRGQECGPEQLQEYSAGFAPQHDLPLASAKPHKPQSLLLH